MSPIRRTTLPALAVAMGTSAALGAVPAVAGPITGQTGAPTVRLSPAEAADVSGAVVAGAAAAGPTTSSKPRGRGYEGLCVDSRGVSVVVDFQDLGGTTVRRCALPEGGQTAFEGTGLDALRAANVRVEGVQRWGFGFVCRLQGKPSATQTLTVNGQPYQEQCVSTPPAGAYWGYWVTSGASGDWQYSQYGASNRQAVNGGFEGWSFSYDQTASTNPAPRTAPRRPSSSALRPFSAATPSISGTARVGSTVKVSVGTWTPTPSTRTYRWLRDNNPIAGATGSSYRPTSADQGHQLSVMVTGQGSDRAKTWSTSAPVKVA